MTPETPAEILPLFPLNVVLFPQARLSLHIFEERYTTLIGESLLHETPFGINLLIDRTIQPVGCTAAVIDVIHRYGDGRMDIVVEGRKRYRFHNLVDMPRPYLCGTISWYDDAAADADDDIRQKAVRLHNTFVAAVFSGSVPPVQLTDIRKSRSFFLVQKAGLDLLQRQAVLSMDTENDRLGFLIRHLESMIPLLASKRKIEELAKNDGYRQE